MKVFLVATLAVAGVFGVPSSRNSCPSLEEIGQWFESEFDTQIPDGIIDCVHNGENCPFADFGEFQGWFESTTGFTIPIPDADFIGAALECLHEGNGCPSEEEAIAFVQNELELDLDDELLSTIYNCAGDFVDQLGLGHLLDYFM